MDTMNVRLQQHMRVILPADFAIQFHNLLMAFLLNGLNRAEQLRINACLCIFGAP